jgi:hypothetical protein
MGSTEMGARPVALWVVGYLSRQAPIPLSIPEVRNKPSSIHPEGAQFEVPRAGAKKTNTGRCLSIDQQL